MSLESNEVDHVPRDTSQTMLYERYGQAIFGYLRLHAHFPEDAEDLLLEVFLAALEHDNLSAFSPGEQLAWLRRVAHNKLLNHYRQAVMQTASEILFQRFSSFGLRGASVNVVTFNSHLAIQVELPSFAANEQQAIDTLVQTGHLEFWCTGPMPVQINTLFDPSRYAQYNPGGGPRFTGRDLDPNALSVSYDQANRPQINFEMQGSAIDSFGRFTARNIGEYLTITFDRKVIESAAIQSAITGPAVITGNFTQQQANALIADLKAGSLPVALKIVK